MRHCRMTKSSCKQAQYQSGLLHAAAEHYQWFEIPCQRVIVGGAAAARRRRPLLLMFVGRYGKLDTVWRSKQIFQSSGGDKKGGVCIGS